MNALDKLKRLHTIVDEILGESSDSCDDTSAETPTELDTILSTYMPSTQLTLEATLYAVSETLDALENAPTVHAFAGEACTIDEIPIEDRSQYD